MNQLQPSATKEMALYLALMALTIATTLISVH